MPAPDSVKFNNGDVVKRVTEEDEHGMIVGIIYRPNGSVEYLCRWPSCTDETKHYDVELEMVEEFVGGEKE